MMERTQKVERRKDGTRAFILDGARVLVRSDIGSAARLTFLYVRLPHLRKRSCTYALCLRPLDTQPELAPQRRIKQKTQNPRRISTTSNECDTRRKWRHRPDPAKHSYSGRFHRSWTSQSCGASRQLRTVPQAHAGHHHCHRQFSRHKLLASTCSAS